MKILMLSLDGSILDKNSISASRMKEYGSICDELHIIILGETGEIAKLSENIKIYPTSSNKILALFKAKKIGNKILNKKDKWVITTQDPFESGFIGWQLARRFNCGLEVQMHGDFYSGPYWKKERLLNRFRWFLGKIVLRRARIVRVVSDRIRKSIQNLNKNIRVMPIFTEAKEVKRIEKERGGLVILSVGNLVLVKNHIQLIEVFAEIKREFPVASRLVIVGDGPLKNNLESTVRNLQLGDSVVLVGHQENLEIYYNQADIFVHLSLYEGWGRVVVEAASYGLPIIMTDVGLAGEIIKNEESGLVVPVNDKEALKQAIMRLAKDKELRKKIAYNAKKIVEQKMCTKEEYLKKIKESWEMA